MNPTTELVSRIVLAWWDKRPFSDEARERRKAKRRARRAKRREPNGDSDLGEFLTDEEVSMPDQVQVTLPDGSQITRSEPLIPARTSTKVAVTGLAAGLPIIQSIQAIEFPWPWLESFTNSDFFVQLATLALAYVVARFSKSPIVTQAL